MFFKSLFRKKTYKTLFTTPSHAQKFCIFTKFRQFYKYDISETDTHNPQAALDAAQKHASQIYGVKQTLFLTNGSTSGIITAVAALCGAGDNVLIWSKAHKCHKNSVELINANPVFYELPMIKHWGISDKVTVDIIKPILDKYKIRALIVTSPSYEGIVSDIESLKDLCEKYGVYLIVDEAHGALYPFCDELPQSAVKHADITVQSLHKTAGGLNPTALIHSNLDIDLQPAFEKITTTSPSYPLLASIEANINYLNSQKGRENVQKLVRLIKALKAENNGNIAFGGDDAAKILIKKEGVSGYELSKRLYDKYNIEDERTNAVSAMLLCGLGTSEKKIVKLFDILKKL